MKTAILALLIANLAGIVFLIARPLPTSPPVEKWPEIEPDPEVSFTYRSELVRVIDGDTVVLNVDLGFETWIHNQTIRLYGIDTPEMRGEERPEGEKGPRLGHKNGSTVVRSFYSPFRKRKALSGDGSESSSPMAKT